MFVSYHKVLASSNAPDLEKYAAHVMVLPAPAAKDATLESQLAKVPKTATKGLLSFAKRTEFKAKAGDVLVFDVTPEQRQVVAIMPRKKSFVWHLKWARQVVEALTKAATKNALLDLRSVSGGQALAVTDAFISAAGAAAFEGPKYATPKKDDKKKKDDKPKSPIATDIFAPGADAAAIDAKAKHAAALTVGTNLVRRLALMAGNDLNCKNYVALATKMAKDSGLQTKFYSMAELKKMKAGAFLAVAQGSDHEDGGILKISYAAKAKKGKGPGAGKLVNFVGKGITFDTGGVNVKPGTYMYGMNGDMAGSAVALALVLVAAEEGWSCDVNSYLAITDNAVGSKAFRPNDVVTALSGKTIEVMHTDAEGRMILADTLHLASQDKPDLMMDFATLTGSCVRAIGTTFSGVFSNRARLNGPAIRAGRASGERVWPFPLDADYADCLKSEIADTKQCRLSGGADHIEASMFLKGFVGKDVPWIHVDLSAIEHEGGLGHVGKTQTGFGVRFADAFVRSVL